MDTIILYLGLISVFIIIIVLKNNFSWRSKNLDVIKKENKLKKTSREEIKIYIDKEIKNNLWN